MKSAKKTMQNTVASKSLVHEEIKVKPTMTGALATVNRILSQIRHSTVLNMEIRNKRDSEK